MARNAASKPARTANRPSVIYRLRITLDVTPPIWRTIEVPDGRLNDLHEWIQTAMGWENAHLHQFTIEGQDFAHPRFELGDERRVGDTLKTHLSDVLDQRRKGFRFRYTYDFGDDWQHDIRYEGCGPPEPKTKYPRCVDGARACPPEDCGGAWGYAHLLEVLADGRHEEHAETKEWAGDVDAERFSATQATRRMRAGVPAWDD